ncbi:MAG: bifunctional [glutamate--ammonia ligase]-adenylyl-L-tyrosine phosphorylase/[glutamate--ammonia-ligase] adenylyltransferase [Psychromonas sp.]
MSLLSDCAAHHVQRLSESIDLSFCHASQLAELKEVLGLSDFVADSLMKQPGLLMELLNSGLLLENDRIQRLKEELQACLAVTDDEIQLHKVLRQFRRKHMVIIAWRELLRKANLAESFKHISFLADELIEQALNWLYEKQCSEQGTPVNALGVRQSLYIFAMGKLGGRELNFSSDIDLIFAYPEHGETKGGRRVINNQSFFTKLGQRLIASLHQITEHGFVYRVDMRLRPFGDSGPLVTSFASVEDYYQTHGREWERYAMVKARVIGEQGQYKKELEALLRPFVYRRYIDFSAIDSLRKMKEMINAEVRRKGLKDNIKLGMGGIREIEFVAQAFQLIHGGRTPVLQCRGLQETLQVIADLNVLPAARVESLLDSYQFLRRVENVLQQIADQQTQTLPSGERDRLRLITVMQFSDWACFYDTLNEVMKNVHDEFNWVIGAQDDDIQSDQDFCELWILDLSEQETVRLLIEKGLPEHIAKELTLLLLSFKNDVGKRPIGPRGQETMSKLLPKILEKICAYKNPIELLQRINELLLKIMCRTAYLELLNENDGALNQLLTLCYASPRVSAQLGRHPILLDELLDPQQLYHPTQLDHYKRDLRQFMLRVPEEDMEQQMEALRQFKQMQFLRIAAADIIGAIKLPEVSDHLTYLSEAIMAFVVHIAWTQMVEKFGCPSCVLGTDDKGFAVIAYGKMGGIEIAYESDLDVVFLHQSDIVGETNGARVIDNQLFYFRLVQRIIHLFSTRTNSGVLYEIDIRLRPSGDAGPLVVSITGYEKYLLNEAWTWEHQALVRARAVFYDTKMFSQFNRVRELILSLPREEAILAKDVGEMRNKMRAHLNRAKLGQFDLKHSPGGLVDIEFIAQYLVLANAAKTDCSLCKWSDNLRIFETCKDLNLLTEGQQKALTDAYCNIRDAGHRLMLSKKRLIVDEAGFEEARQAVLAVWLQFLGEGNQAL